LNSSFLGDHVYYAIRDSFESAEKSPKAKPFKRNSITFQWCCSRLKFFPELKIVENLSNLLFGIPPQEITEQSDNYAVDERMITDERTGLLKSAIKLILLLFKISIKVNTDALFG